MNLGIIATPNAKGQIVIPKEIREQLGITPNLPLSVVVRETYLCLYPIEGISTKTQKENSFYKILAKTQGAWLKDNWPQISTQRKNIELRASQSRKKLW